ncbi:MAG: Flavin reductase like domain protein [Methanoregula sp. PtaU1.Bin051]|nr:MAG: Flavin reductase like domain protein [Methanoregula sp. PtaU1.Bin051]
MKRSIGAKPVAYPLPVFVIGTYNPDGVPDAMVAAWCGICASEPPCIAVTINPNHQTFRNIRNTNAFTVSIPSSAYLAETDYCGMVSGKDHAKFPVTGLSAVRAEHVNAPYIGEFPVVLECRVFAWHEIGSARQVIGEILDTKIDEAVFGTDGKPDLQKIGTFAFDVMRMEYYSLGNTIGRAWDSGKKFIK